MPVDPNHIQYAFWPRDEKLFKQEFIRIGYALVFYILENGTVVQAEDWPHSELTVNSDLNFNLKSGRASRERAPKGAKSLIVLAAEKKR